jgi:hypothetical protein
MEKPLLINGERLRLLTLWKQLNISGHQQRLSEGAPEKVMRQSELQGNQLAESNRNDCSLQLKLKSNKIDGFMPVIGPQPLSF